METVYLALRVLVSLAVVLGVLWALQRRLNKGGRFSRAPKPVTVVARQSIASKASVVVLDVDGQRFLLGVTEQSVTVLNTSDAPSPVIAVEEAPAAALAPAPAPAPAPLPESASAPRRSGSAAFARVLSQVSQAPAPTTVPAATANTAGGAAPVAYLPQPAAAASPLDGSILSPTTWKRTAAAIRRAR